MAEKDKPTFKSAFALLPDSLDLLKANWKVFGILFILPLLSAMPSFFPMQETPSTPPSVWWNLSGGRAAGIILGGLVGVVILLTLLVISYSLLYAATLDAAKGKKLALGTLWKAVKGKISSLVVLGLLVGLIVICGLIVFIIPGVFFIKRYYLAPYYLLDKNLGILDSMRQSFEDSKKYGGPIWGLLGVTLLFGILSAFSGIMGILGFVLTTAYTAAPAIRYQEIQKAD